MTAKAFETHVQDDHLAQIAGSDVRVSARRADMERGDRAATHIDTNYKGHLAQQSDLRKPPQVAV